MNEYFTYIDTKRLFPFNRISLRGRQYTKESTMIVISRFACILTAKEDLF